MTLTRAGYQMGRLLAVVSGLRQAGSGVSAAEKTGCKFSLTHEAIKSLSPDELKAVIKGALEYRLSRCRNIHFVLDHRVGLCAFGEQVPSETTLLLKHEQVECWAIGYTFRIDKEDRDRETGARKYVRIDSYDAETGVVKYLGMKPDGSDKYAAIDSRMQRQAFSAPYIYWLNMPDQHLYIGEFFIAKIVAQINTWQVRVLPDGLVELVCDWSLILNKDAAGKLTYTLDPVKGFLPISCHGRWKNPTPKPNANHIQYELRFVVDESTLVSDLWMPTKLRDATCLNDDKAKGNLHIQTVKTVELGSTKESDVRLPFSQGTSVQDRLRGITFKVGPNGEEETPQTLYMTLPNPAADKDQTAGLRKAPNELRWIYIALGNVITIGMFGYLIIRRRHASRAEAQSLSEAESRNDAARIEPGPVSEPSVTSRS
jgi:hypothetical protein